MAAPNTWWRWPITVNTRFASSTVVIVVLELTEEGDLASGRIQDLPDAAESALRRALAQSIGVTSGRAARRPRAGRQDRRPDALVGAPTFQEAAPSSWKASNRTSCLCVVLELRSLGILVTLLGVRASVELKRRETNLPRRIQIQ
jgi:hypothetical protein